MRNPFGEEIEDDEDEPVDDFNWAEEFGVFIAAAVGLDKTWMPKGKCQQWRYEDGLDDHPTLRFRPTPWHVGSSSKVQVGAGHISGRELSAVALLICHSCPVQWDCARYAIRGRIQAGTWAMKISYLRDLQLEWQRAGVDVFAIIDDAQVQGVPVQVAIERHRNIDSLATAV